MDFVEYILIKNSLLLNFLASGKVKSKKGYQVRENQ